MWRRATVAIIGILLLAVGMGMLKYVNLGIDPYSTFVTGLSAFLTETVGWSFFSYGNLFMIMTAIMMGVIALIDWHYINVGTIIHLAIVGKLTEWVQDFFEYILPLSSDWQQYGMLVAAFVILSLGLAAFFAGEIGVPAYDALALHMAKKKIMQFRWCRIVTDGTCLVVGSIFGTIAVGFWGIVGPQIGVGTLLAVFATGPCVQFYRTKFLNKLAMG